MNHLVPLNQVPINKKCRIKKISLAGLVKRRILDLGFIIDTEIEVVQKSPLGDPRAYFVRGALIAIRSEIASSILVEIL